LAIDKLVFENRRAVIKFFKKVPRKGRLIIIATALGVFLLFSEMGNADAIGLSSVPQAPIMRYNEN